MKRKYAKDYTLLGKMIAKHVPFKQEDFDYLSTTVRLAFHKLAIGTATPSDLRDLGAAMNTCALRSVSIGAECSHIANDAIQALGRIHDRHARTGAWGLDYADRTALGYGLDLHDELLRHSDMGSLAAALRVVMGVAA